MDIGVPLRELGEYDIAPLRDVILAQDESVWLGNTYRQQAYEVHQQTQSIVMVFTGAGWPDIEVRREPGWDVLAEQALPLMHRILADHYPPGDALFAPWRRGSSAGGVIKPHRDKAPLLSPTATVSISPSTPNNRVRFMIDGRPYRMAVGTVYEINNQQQHSVMNKGRKLVSILSSITCRRSIWGQSPSGRQRPGQERPSQEARPGRRRGTSGIA